MVPQISHSRSLELLICCWDVLLTNLKKKNIFKSFEDKKKDCKIITYHIFIFWSFLVFLRCWLLRFSSCSCYFSLFLLNFLLLELNKWTQNRQTNERENKWTRGRSQPQLSVLFSLSCGLCFEGDSSVLISPKNIKNETKFWDLYKEIKKKTSDSIEAVSMSIGTMRSETKKLNIEISEKRMIIITGHGAWRCGLSSVSSDFQKSKLKQ